VALSLLLTCAALDHYPGAHRPLGYAGLFVPDQPSLASADAAQAGAPRQAAGVFAYLKPTHPQYRATVAALAQLKVPVRVYASGVAAPAGAAHLDWHLRPLPLAGALAGATLVVCHAGMGVVGAALHAGRPLVLLPGSYEQLLTARNVERLGAGLWVHPEAGADRVRKALKRALDDATLAQAAGAFARANARAPGATTAWLAETAGRIHAIAAGGRAG
jgi:UDP:flavonoid glycosyltransferase YjiC (YdhE family)